MKTLINLTLGVYFLLILISILFDLILELIS